MKAQTHSPDVAEAIVKFRERKAAVAREAIERFAAMIEDLERSELAREFRSRVNDGVDGCHLWTGHVNRTWAPDYENGFGEFYPMNDILGTSLAHRIAVMLEYRRPIPEGHHIYPACNEHLCCNTAHLKIRPNEGKRSTGVFVSQFFCREAA